MPFDQLPPLVQALRLTRTCRPLHVVIVGSGVSGLHCARVLHSLCGTKGVSISILEASDRIGGRIRVEPDFFSCGRGLDIGGEFIHGSARNPFYEAVCSAKLDVVETFDFSRPKREALLIEGSLVHLDDESDPELVRALNLIDKISETSFLEDISFEEYLIYNKVPRRLYRVLEALYARTYGTRANELSLADASREDQATDGQSDNARLRRGTGPFLEHLQSGLTVFPDPFKVVETTSASHPFAAYLDTRVTRICYGGRDECKATIHFESTSTRVQSGTVEADFVVVTVPLPVLRDGDIEFEPALPQSKMLACSRIRMHSGAKVVCKFSRRFWPEDLDIVICDHEIFAQFWTNGPFGKKKDEWIVSGFVMGDDSIARLQNLGSDEERANMFLDFLDETFGNGKRVATESFTGTFAVYNWGDHPFVRGAYSSPSIGASFADRLALAETVDGCLVFAGEATSLGSSGTIHSAMETGARAAGEVIRLAGLHPALMARL